MTFDYACIGYWELLTRHLFTTACCLDQRGHRKDDLVLTVHTRVDYWVAEEVVWLPKWTFHQYGKATTEAAGAEVTMVMAS